MIPGRENCTPSFWDCLDPKGPKNVKKINLGTKSIRETILTHTIMGNPVSGNLEGGGNTGNSVLSRSFLARFILMH